MLEFLFDIVRHSVLTENRWCGIYANCQVDLRYKGQTMIDLDYTFFIQLFLFISLAIALKFILFDPYLKNLKKRDEILIGYRKEAEDIKQKVEQLSQKFDESIRLAREDARKEYENIKNEANNEREKILQEARQRVNEIIEKGREDLKKEKENIMADASKHIDAISNQITEKILKGSGSN